MESPNKAAATGVSRSGRVRKKSSKLTDFESPDEIDARFRRRPDRSQKVSPSKPVGADSLLYVEDDMIEVKDEPLEADDWGVEGAEMEEGDEDDEDEDEEEEDGSVGCEDGGEGNMQYSDPLQVDEDSTDVSRETSGYTQAQSLYFSEKQAKKSTLVKGGRAMQKKKAQRKDKGKSRFTAYMLWAREIRPGIIQANPNMDFSAVNKRLGELWALVPTTQKYNWKRRAKRLAAKGNQKGGLISTGKPSRPPPPARANLINKGGVKPSPRRDPMPATPPASTTPASHHRQHGQKGHRQADLSPSTAYRVTGTNPIDVAAHIKLLGESLNNIGQKLKEHEGQIAVSGSLSVLLDSMLCVLGPLTCLANEVTVLKGSISNTTLTQTLDNIAYIMPGIV